MATAVGGIHFLCCATRDGPLQGDIAAACDGDGTVVVYDLRASQPLLTVSGKGGKGKPPCSGLIQRNATPMRSTPAPLLKGKLGPAPCARLPPGHFWLRLGRGLG
jgi:hypothetical protein